MNELMMLRGTQPREILQTVVEKKTPAIMSYLSKYKWHVVRAVLTNLGANVLTIQLLPRKNLCPLNICLDQPVGISLKHRYGKFVFETKVVGLEPSADQMSGGTILLAVPDRLEVVQRRNYFRVNVPRSLKVNVVLWHRQTDSSHPIPPENYHQGRLVDISAGGAQVVIDAVLKSNFKKDQFIGLTFTPMPYETPLLFNAQIRNILPTADGKNICLGLQTVGLEASSQGHQVIRRLCNIVERYYRINQSDAKQQDFGAAALACSDVSTEMQNWISN